MILQGSDRRVLRHLMMTVHAQYKIDKICCNAEEMSAQYRVAQPAGGALDLVQRPRILDIGEEGR